MMRDMRRRDTERDGNARKREREKKGNMSQLLCLRWETETGDDVRAGDPAEKC